MLASQGYLFKHEMHAMAAFYEDKLETTSACVPCILSGCCTLLQLSPSFIPSSTSSYLSHFENWLLPFVNRFENVWEMSCVCVRERETDIVCRPHRVNKWGLGVGGTRLIQRVWMSDWLSWYSAVNSSWALKLFKCFYASLQEQLRAWKPSWHSNQTL